MNGLATRRPLSAMAIGPSANRAIMPASAPPVIGGPASAFDGSFEPHSATAAPRGRAFTDQLNAARRECVDEFHQRLDVTADHTLGGLHPLDGWQRQPCYLRQLALVDA